MFFRSTCHGGLHRISDEEAKYKLCKVVKVDSAKKASIGRNPFQHGHQAVIPYCVTHDGRTVRYPDPLIRVHDVVKFDIATSKITDHLKFNIGQLAIITRGANIGRIGVIQSHDRHPGSFDIIHLKDARGHEFATRINNVFVIGQGTKEWISLPRGKGLKYSILEEKERREKAALKKKE